MAARKRLEKLRQARGTSHRIPTSPDDFAQYRADPVGFAREVLHERLWPKQEEILLSLTTDPQIAIRSGQKCGKSRVAAMAALWFVSCFPLAYVILTAPTGRQVREVLWKEVRNLYARAAAHGRPLGGKMNLSPAGGLRFADGRAIIGFSTSATKAENMAGPSGAALMYVVDEASGYSQSIFDAIQGNLGGSPMGRLMILSNPTQPAGFFFDAFHRSAPFWRRFVISSEEAAKHANEFPGLMRPETIARREKDVGRESPWFQIRILGNFPSTASNAVVSLAAIDAAKESFLSEAVKRLCKRFTSGQTLESDRAHGLSLAEAGELFGPDDGPLEIGVDVARFGDDRTVIQPRRGRFMLPYVAVNGFDTQAVAGAVLMVARALRRGHERAHVKVDVIGYGAGVCDALRRDENREIVTVTDVNVSCRSDDPEKFPNLRSQLWFSIPDFLREGGMLHTAAGEEDGKLDAELLTPTYKIDPQGRQVVEPKDAIKQRLGRSPDIADAVALAIYNARPVIAAGGFTTATPADYDAQGIG